MVSPYPTSPSLRTRREARQRHPRHSFADRLAAVSEFVIPGRPAGDRTQFPFTRDAGLSLLRLHVCDLRGPTPHARH
jgi:hypothetical protein